LGLREWLAGGIPDLEAQRDDAFANYHKTIGAIAAIEATLRWLDENEGAAGTGDGPDRPASHNEGENDGG